MTERNASEARTRVLLGPLSPLARVGINSTLSMNSAVEIVGYESDADDAIEAARRLAPDAIILHCDRDRDVAVSVRLRLRQAAPAAKLIFCPTDEQRIDVLDPGASALRRSGVTTADGLRIELSSHPTKAQE